MLLLKPQVSVMWRKQRRCRAGAARKADL